MAVSPIPNSTFRYPAPGPQHKLCFGVSIWVTLDLLLTERSECSDGDERLVNEFQQTGEGVREGRLEICYQGVWGAVYDTDWSAQDAAVTCQDLGFEPEGMSSQCNH